MQNKYTKQLREKRKGLITKGNVLYQRPCDCTSNIPVYRKTIKAMIGKNCTSNIFSTKRIAHGYKLGHLSEQIVILKITQVWQILTGA